MNTEEKFIAIKKGLLRFIILKIINNRQVYVLDIINRLKDTQFSTKEGTLYPLLSNLRREELVEYEWIESDVGPPRKYYKLTLKGKDYLDKAEKYWQIIIKEIQDLL